jgi:hypothetical protein
MDSINQLFESTAEWLDDFVPNIVAAIVILIGGWILAVVLRYVVSKLMHAGKMDERFKNETGEPIKLGTVLTNFIFYLSILFVLLGVLNVIGVDGVLEPVQGMFDKFVSVLPNLFAAALIAFIGFIVARILSTGAAMLVRGLDRHSDRLGMSEDFSLSKLVGQLVFIFIFIPILVSALDALKIEAISGPATEMLAALMTAIPNILAAAIILGVAYFVGRFVKGVVTELLENLGANAIPEKVGIGGLIPSGSTASSLTGAIVFFFIMLGASVSAVDKLAMPHISDILSDLLVFGGHVALGLIILAAGNLIASFAYKALNADGSNQFVASLARFATLGLALAMALDAMGLAENIVNLAFGLTLGAVAVAVALSFGLGGREAAGKQMEHWLRKLRGED